MDKDHNKAYSYKIISTRRANEDVTLGKGLEGVELVLKSQVSETQLI